jgi:signal transduction histidine kinase
MPFVMNAVRAFVKRHTLWLGLITVIVPLVIILGLQYRSLVQLQQLSMVADKWKLKDTLWALSNDIQDHYQARAKEVLDVSPGTDSESIAEAAITHFRKHDWKGAARLWVVDFAKEDAAQITFYDRERCVLKPDPDCADTRAVNVACAPWKILGQEGAVMASRKITGMVTDHKDRILLHPITDKNSRLIGMAGMLLSTRYFMEDYFPSIIEDTLRKSFPEQHRQDNLIVAVHDATDRLLFASRPLKGQVAEVSMPMPYIFKDWKLGIHSRHYTAEQWARLHFVVNLCLSVLMTLVLLGGMALALRTASRQMKLSQMKADFVSNVSHELRTPIASIRVFGEFLKLGRVKEVEKIREYGEYIENESRRLTQLINNILDFSRIESSQKEYAFEKVELLGVLRETIQAFDVRLKQEGFSLRIEQPQTSLPQVVVDRDAIGQAFINLLDNAVKYSGSAREIVVQVAQQNGWVSFSVRDGGIGIAKEEQEKIFEKFYRVSTGLVHDVKGSGLGLSLVKHIVEAHQGRVTVDSQPGTGTTFTVHLPVAHELVHVNAQPPIGEPQVGLGVKSQS